MPDEALAGALDHTDAVVEVLGAPEKGIVDLYRAGVDRGGVELAQKPHLRRRVGIGSPPPQVPEVPLVRHHDQIPVAEPLGLELAGAVLTAVIPMIFQRSHGARVRGITLVPAAGAGRVDDDPLVESSGQKHCPQDDLGHRRPADVAGADDTDAVCRGLTHAPIEPHAHGTTVADLSQLPGTSLGTSLPRGARQSSEVNGAGRSTVRCEGAEDDLADLSIVAMPVRRQNVRTPQPQECTMAQYVVLIYENESDYASASPEVYGEVMDAHNRFAEEVVARGGKIAGGNALQGTDTATSIRGDVVTDGPFVETKEALGGFYLIEADDLDQAIKIAGMVPARFGGVEVRPVMVFPEA